MTNTIRVRAMESINSRNIADFLHSLDSIQQTILLTKSGTTVNAKSMLGLLTLSINIPLLNTITISTTTFFQAKTYAVSACLK